MEECADFLIDYAEQHGPISVRGFYYQAEVAGYIEDEPLNVVFEQVAVTESQIQQFGLSTRPHKRNSPADRAWPHNFACELDAIPPDALRDLVEACINAHMPQDQLDILKEAERSEREIIRKLVNGRSIGGGF
jgi:hypothetical protein